MRAALVFCCALLLASCAPEPARLRPDADGVMVAVQIRYHPAVLDGLAMTRTLVVERYPYWGNPYAWPHDPWYRYPGPPMAYEPRTSAWLLLGEGPAEAQFARIPLEGSERRENLRLRAGRIVHATLQCSGGRSGMLDLGSLTIPPEGGCVVADLDGAKPAIRLIAPPPGP